MLKNILVLGLVLSFGWSMIPAAQALNARSEMEFDPEFEELFNSRLTELQNDRALRNQLATVPAYQQQNVLDAVAVSTLPQPLVASSAVPNSQILIGASNGQPPYSDACVGRSHYGQLSHRQDNGFCYGPAPKGYKATIDPYICQNMEQFFDTCPPFSRNLGGFGRCGATSGATWGPEGKPSSTAYGTWTSWWKGVSAYCMKEGYWSSSNAGALPDVNGRANFTFTVAGTAGAKIYDSEMVRNDTEMVSVKGMAETTTGRGSRTLTSPTFNSPFIYLRNQTEAVGIKLHSLWNQYKSQLPAFNQADGWLVETPQESPLFYELGLTQVEFSRAGQNFDSRAELASFLQDGDFFDQLGFSDTEKENSLGYLLPKITESSYYYLTILSPEAIDKLSTTEITPTPDTLVRRYFAVYPTETPILTTEELNYPIVVSDEGFTVRDYGEILVTPEMFVTWK